MFIALVLIALPATIIVTKFSEGKKQISHFRNPFNTIWYFPHAHIRQFFFFCRAIVVKNSPVVILQALDPSYHSLQSMRRLIRRVLRGNNKKKVELQAGPVSLTAHILLNRYVICDSALQIMFLQTKGSSGWQTSSEHLHFFARSEEALTWWRKECPWREKRYNFSAFFGGLAVQVNF